MLSAFRQLQTYKREVPSLFQFNEVLVVSDGRAARVGTITGSWERFAPWRTTDGKAVAAPGTLELQRSRSGILKISALEAGRPFVSEAHEARALASGAPA